MEGLEELHMDYHIPKVLQQRNVSILEVCRREGFLKVGLVDDLDLHLQTSAGRYVAIKRQQKEVGGFSRTVALPTGDLESRPLQCGRLEHFVP